jgi:hypothetical protein
MATTLGILPRCAAALGHAQRAIMCRCVRCCVAVLAGWLGPRGCSLPRVLTSHSRGAVGACLLTCEWQPRPPPCLSLISPASLDQNCSQTLRRRMNQCLYRRFIRQSTLNLLAAELIRRVLKLGRRIIRRYKLDFNSSNSAPLSFPSILLLQPCFHELFELDSIQGTWVCIFYGFWSAWSSY